jgi:protein phosphatase
MRALGATDKCEIDMFEVESDVDAIMLCSDGLTNMLSFEQIERVLNEDEITVDNKLIKLVKKANVRGGLDNISIAYLDKEGARK